MTAPALPLGRTRVLAAAAVVGFTLFAAVLVRQFGPVGLALPFAAAAGLAALQRPGLLAIALFGAVVVLEVAGGGLIGETRRLYEPVKAFGPSPIELLLVALGVAVFVTRRAQRLPFIAPAPFTAPLVLMAIAALSGIVVGQANGATFGEAALAAHPVVTLIVTPVLVANVLDRPGALRTGVLVAAGLALAKAVAGLVSLSSGGAGVGFVDRAITYYEPAANFLMLLAVLLAVVAVMRRLPLPLWARWSGLICTVALVLSYRRSFWIAGALALVALLVVAAGPLGRRLVVPFAAVVAVLVWVAVSGGLVTEVQGPVAERATSLRPERVESNPEDRYRLDERRNVLAEVREHPATGLGLAVPWAQRYPLSVEHENGQDYVHMTLLWFWLKLGILGTISYLWLSIAAVWTGVRVWREHQDALVRGAALAIAAGVFGVMVAELTASFTGVEERFTIVLAFLLGFLAAARAQLPPRTGALT